MKRLVKRIFLLLTISIIVGVNSEAVDFTLKDVITHTIAPNRFVDLGSGHYFIEFPKAAIGTIDITITATSSQSVTLKFGEKKIGNVVNTNPGYDIVYSSEPLSVSPGTKTYRITQHPETWPDPQPDQLFPTISFRYVEVSNCPGTLTASDINQISVTYPFDDNASSFTSNNSTLNAVWELCKYTMKDCSWLGIYVDGTRERAPYEADAYIQQLGHYCQDTQAYAIARNTMSFFMTDPTWPAEWKFCSIFMAWAEYMWTGDDSFLSSNYSTLKTKTLESYARSDGLINPPGPGGGTDSNSDIVDWPPPNRDSYDFKDYATAPNALYYHALVLMAKIATVLGQTSDATSYMNKASQVYSSFQSVFYSGSNGHYKDGDGSNHYSLHASAYPLAVDLVPSDNLSSVVNYIKSRGMVTGVYGAQWLLEGLYKADEEDYALSLLTSTGNRSWYNMISWGSTVTTETWHPDYTAYNQCTWNHAWGAAPANLIPRCLMGIDPITAGFGKIQIKPQIGTLTSASVTIPTVKGSVSVSVTKGTTYKITATIPSGATAKVYVKDYDSLGTSVTVDGVIQNGTAEGRYVVFDNVSSGTHTFEKPMGPVAIQPEMKTSMVKNASTSILRVVGNTSCHIPEQWHQFADAVAIFNCRGVVLGKENIAGKNSISCISLKRRYGYGIFFIKPLQKK